MMERASPDFDMKRPARGDEALRGGVNDLTVAYFKTL